jgi:tetratricopeptide (TPR) repeat protein
VCDASLDSLQDLVEASLLKASDGRFLMLETIREFAATASNVDRPDVLHRRYYLEHAKNLGARFDVDGSDPRAMKAIRAEDNNLRAAFASAGDGEDRELVVEAASALTIYWNNSGIFEEGLTALKSAYSTDMPSRLRLQALRAFGVLYGTRGEIELATDADRQRLALARSVGDERHELAALNNLALRAWSDGEHEEAVTLIREVRRRVGEPLPNLVLILWTAGNLEDAEAETRDVIASTAAAGDVGSANVARGTLAWLLYERGAVDEAVAELRHSLGSIQDVGGRTLAEGLRLCACLAADRQDPDAAVLAASANSLVDGFEWPHEERQRKLIAARLAHHPLQLTPLSPDAAVARARAVLDGIDECV